MRAVEIIDIKNFMVTFLLQDTFDQFLMQRAQVLTSSLMELDGKRNADWYDTDNLPPLMMWSEMRHTVFEYIKGNRTPSKMMIDLQVPTGLAEKIWESKGFFSSGEIPGFHIQVRYEHEHLHIVTAASHRQFTADRTGEQLWDEVFCTFLKDKKIVFDLLNT
jgi:DNA-binding protein Fis